MWIFKLVLEQQMLVAVLFNLDSNPQFHHCMIWGPLRLLFSTCASTCWTATPLERGCLCNCQSIPRWLSSLKASYALIIRTLWSLRALAQPITRQFGSGLRFGLRSLPAGHRHHGSCFYKDCLTWPWTVSLFLSFVSSWAAEFSSDLAMVRPLCCVALALAAIVQKAYSWLSPFQRWVGL